MNKLYYGDNLQVLREYIADQSVDLVYLDPPFNSRQDYNVLFAEKDGSRSASQVTAFKDTWEWNEEAARAYEESVAQGGRVAETMRAFRTLLGGTDMLAYLSMMAPRLVELHRVLRDHGSIYLHCDATAGHYLKLLMDGVFGVEVFRNEITWKRAETIKGNFGQGSRFFDRNTDSLLFYSKSNLPTFHAQFTEYSEQYLKKSYKHVEAETGRRYRLISMIGPGGAAKGNPEYEVLGVTRYWRYSREKMADLIAKGLVVQSKPGTVPNRKQYLDEGKGVAVQSLWTDVPALHANDAERLGYPTQKPEALLERILRASSNEGDVVLDPFCGCGTTVQVAQKLNRRWIGIDITHLAIGLIKTRLHDTFGPEIKATYDVIGEPTDLSGAEQLALENKFQFQAWALGLCNARRTDSDRKGADRGIDGRAYFFDDNSLQDRSIIFSVKGGRNVGVAEVRDLNGVLQREEAAIGVYISLADTTKPMQREAAEAGFYTAPDGSRVPRMQLLSIAGLLAETERLQLPPHARMTTFKKAPRYQAPQPRTMRLNLSGEA